MNPAAPTDLYGFTAEDQARRDIASALRDVRTTKDAPAGIVSVVRCPDAPEEADAAVWLAHSTRPDTAEARCQVHVVSGKNGAEFFDVAAMVAELAADIEAKRAEFAPANTAPAAVAGECAA